MKQKKVKIAIGFILLFHMICPSAGSAVGSSPIAPEFSLLDQYGKSFEITYPQEKIQVLVFADKWGCTQVEGWVRPLYERYEDKVSILGVAQLEGVPRWLRSTLVGIFKRNIKFSVMMDWTGEVSRGYEYAGGKAFLVIVNRQGTIQHQVQGEASQNEIERCRRVIDDLEANLPDSILQ